MTADLLAEANALLGAQGLSGLRLLSWNGSDATVRFEVFNVEWEKIVFGRLVFHDVRYVQAPNRTSWGYRVRLAPEADLPWRERGDTKDLVFELYAPDGTEPSAFVIASALDVERMAESTSR